MTSVKIPKKVNRHVIKAIDFLQTSRTDFVHIGAIQDQVRRSLRYTKPVSNLDDVIHDSLRKQTELGIITRSGSSRYALTLAFSGLRSDRNAHKIKKNEVNRRTNDSLSADEVASVRKMLRSAQQPLVRTKPSIVHGKGKPRRYLNARSTKPIGNSTPIICDKSAKNTDSFNIPKKVNRHVFKAVRNLSHSGKYKFVPVDEIKMEAKWSMKNLKPVKDIETVIERSLTNLRNNGVLSERLGSYSLSRVHSLQADSSYEIFGKVSKSFFHGTSIDLGGQISTQTNFADLNSRPVKGTESPIDLSGDPFHPSLVVSEYQTISYENPSEVLLDEPMSEETSSLVPIIIDVRATEGVFGVEPRVVNASSIECNGSPFHGPLVTFESLSQEKQSDDESPNISYMKTIELPLEEPMPEQTSSSVPITTDFRVTERVYEGEPNFENTSLTRRSDITFVHDSDSHVSFQRAAEIFYDLLLQHILNRHPTLNLREDNLPSFNGAQLSSMTSDIDLNIGPVEGNFGTAPSVENASLKELDGSNCHVPLVNSKPVSQEIQNVKESPSISNIKESEMPLDKPISDDLKASVCQETQEQVYANSECEMSLRASSQDHNVSFSLAAQRFHESWLQANEPPTLFLPEANSEAEESANT